MNVTPKMNELRDLAQELYMRRVGPGVKASRHKAEAVNAYRQAEAFLAVSQDIEANGIPNTPVGSKPGTELADCCAPNLSKHHPLNIVAKLHTDRKGVKTAGDLGKARKIYAYLIANKLDEKAPSDVVEEFVNTFNRHFDGLAWNLATINLSRLVFAPYGQAA